MAPLQQNLTRQERMSFSLGFCLFVAAVFALGLLAIAPARNSFTRSLFAAEPAPADPSQSGASKDSASDSPEEAQQRAILGATVARLIERMDDDDPRVREAAREELARIGPDVVPWLRPALKHPSA